ncbi:MULTISPECIES: ABC transporter substrate-binding protein [Planktothricoides]|uniref:ABC transporter substrate-binding protein n=2 Tax=Planktothricoides raciborskii TaxID=132608 RepID=A0ABR8EGJ7_9CYAN|nr:MULTISPECIES: ABC transporter substrate-binding protein [Planktothricoides]MBD2545736.1 ABC transporter substrate-binding protein [Planktothricoides raciborskii FACHB-1370]MBD2582693.1 ABC transporter substrate-binding protein [Planktothricoides raciborskii FACHB-1261]
MAPHGHAVWADMPKDTVDLTQDLIKMGVYSSEVVDLAKTLTENQLKVSLSQFFRDSLFERSASRNRLILEQPDLEQPDYELNSSNLVDRLCLEVVQEAGGIQAAFAAAFGDRQGELFENTIKTGKFNRRQFLARVLTVAALIMLTNCQKDNTADLTSDSPNDLAQKLEKNQLKIGFMPVTCATPIIMSQPLGFYEKYGLKVELVKMQNWAQVRDAAIAGELDAYHMIAAMPLAISLGLGSARFPIKLASIENINGNAMTVAIKHKNKVKSAANLKGFTIAIPFIYSMNNLLLRYYLAAGGVNPDRDVKLVVLTPADMVIKLANGEIDAMMCPGPFNQTAVAEKLGFIHILSSEIWPGHPCCCLATGQPWIEENPTTFRALNKAIIDGCNYASQSQHRPEIARAIAAPEYLNQPESLVKAVLTGSFEDGLGNTHNVRDRIDFDPYPWKSFSYWITTQFQRWNLMPSNVDHEAIADEVFLTGLARHLAKKLGQTPPTVILRKEQLKYDQFDPTDPESYLQGQIKKHGF